MKTYLSEKFPNLKLERPLFYSWPIGIRFEIGNPDIKLWIDSKKTTLNKEYFDEALKRAKSIFDFLFHDEDNIIFVYQQYSDGRRKINRRSHIMQLLDKSNILNRKYSRVKNIYELTNRKSYWHRLSLSLKKSELNIPEIINYILYSDFGSGCGECYFINKSKDTILILYDDRGMDIIANNKDNLTAVYKTYNKWILDYDREQIDKIFKQ